MCSYTDIISYFSGQQNVAALQQQQQLQQQLQQQVLALTSSPFGDSPLFRSLTVGLPKKLFVIRKSVALHRH